MVVGTEFSPVGGLKFLKGDVIAVPSPGQVTVIELWAKWCGPCRQVFPHLTEIYKERKDKGLVVVGISIEDDPSLDAFVKGEGERMGYTVAVDTQGVMQGHMQRAGVAGIPHAFVVNRSGKVVYSGHPAQPDFTSAIDKALAAAHEPERQALPLVTESVEELKAMSVKQLKKILADRQLSTAGLAEKQDLVDMIDRTCRNVTYFS